MNAFEKIGALAVISVLAVGCGGPAQEKENEGTKLQYEAEKNLVEVVTLKKQPFSRQLVSNGKLVAFKKATLYFPSQDVVTRIECCNGDRVRAGEVIAAQDLVGLQLDVETAELSLYKAELEFYDILAGQGYAAKDTLSVPKDLLRIFRSKSGYDAAELSLRKAKERLQSATIVAPFSGKVADISQKLHARSTADPFCTLMDDSRMDVEFTVLESEYVFLSEGLPVQVIPYADPEHPAKGKIMSINPTVDRNGQVKVVASIPNNGHLIDGMNVKVIVSKEVSDQYVVPKNAVVIRDNLDVVFRYHNGKAVWTYVKVLMSNSEFSAIVPNTERNANFSEGDSVIVSGHLNLADGSEVSLKK